MTRLATALCAIGATAVVAAQAPAQSGQVFRSGVDVTTIDVTVIARNGDPIRDLKADDFTVTVDGKPRAIVSAQFVGFNEPSAGESRAEAPAPPRDYSANDRTARGRLIVLLVDQGNIRMGAERSVLRAAEGFLDRLTPSDRVALLTIPTGPVIAFTGDRARIKNGLHHIAGQYHLPAIRHNIAATEALLIEDGDAETLRKVVERECPRGDSGCPQEIELEARGMAPEVRARGLDTVRALSDAFKFLKSIDGSKVVAMVSEGLILDQQRFPSGLPEDVEQLAAQARATVFVLRLDQSSFDATDAKPFRASDVTAQTIGLETVAGATGGELLTVVGTGVNIFDRMTRELSGEYLIGIETTDRDRDGKPHRIKVSVKRDRVEVRSRRTFEADATPPRQGEASAGAVIMRALRTPLPSSGLPIRISNYVLLDADRSKVRVVLAAEIGEKFTQPTRLAIGYELMDAAGQVVGGHAAPETLMPTADGRLRYRQEFSVPPGAYTFKIAATDATGRLGSLDRPVSAELVKAGPVSIADLIVNDERGAERVTELEVEPIVASGRFTVAVDMRTAPGELPKDTDVSLEVTDHTGKRATTSPATVISSSDGARHVVRATVDVAALPPGMYVARVIVRVPGQPSAAVGRAFQCVR